MGISASASQIQNKIRNLTPISGNSEKIQMTSKFKNQSNSPQTSTFEKNYSFPMAAQTLAIEKNIFDPIDMKVDLVSTFVL